MNQKDPVSSAAASSVPPKPPAQDNRPAPLSNPRLPCYVEFDHKSPLGVLILTVRDHLSRLGKDQARHKGETTRITMLTVGLSAASSVLLGLSFKDPATSLLDPVYLKNIALFFTALIAVVNAYDALFKPRRLWVREARSFGLLKDILLKIELRAAGIAPDSPIKAEEIESFRAEIARILEEDLEAWVRQHGEELLGGGKSPVLAPSAAPLAAPSVVPKPAVTPALVAPSPGT